MSIIDHLLTRGLAGVDITRVFTILFGRILGPVSLFLIFLGAVGIAFDRLDPSGGPSRAVRRVALAAMMSLISVCAYVAVPIVLNELDYTPSPGHVRFYGLFFAPPGLVAGALAVVFGALYASVPYTRNIKPRVISVLGLVVGYVVMWLVFYVYSRVMLASGGILYYAVLRASVTAVIGAALFSVTPYLVHDVEKRPIGRLAPIGYTLFLFGLLLYFVTTAAVTILSTNSNIF